GIPKIQAKTGLGAQNTKEVLQFPNNVAIWSDTIDSQNFVSGFQPLGLRIAFGAHLGDEAAISDHLVLPAIVVADGVSRWQKKCVRIVQRIERRGNARDGHVVRSCFVNALFGCSKLRLEIDAVEFRIIVVRTSSPTARNICWSRS